jgi:hypothetical protein
VRGAAATAEAGPPTQDCRPFLLNPFHHRQWDQVKLGTIPLVILDLVKV